MGLDANGFGGLLRGPRHAAVEGALEQAGAPTPPILVAACKVKEGDGGAVRLADGTPANHLVDSPAWEMGCSEDRYPYLATSGSGEASGRRGSGQSTKVELSSPALAPIGTLGVVGAGCSASSSAGARVGGGRRFTPWQFRWRPLTHDGKFGEIGLGR